MPIFFKGENSEILTEFFKSRLFNLIEIPANILSGFPKAFLERLFFHLNNIDRSFLFEIKQRIPLAIFQLLVLNFLPILHDIALIIEKSAILSFGWGERLLQDFFKALEANFSGKKINDVQLNDAGILLSNYLNPFALLNSSINKEVDCQKLSWLDFDKFSRLDFEKQILIIQLNQAQMNFIADLCQQYRKNDSSYSFEEKVNFLSGLLNPDALNRINLLLEITGKQENGLFDAFNRLLIYLYFQIPFYDLKEIQFVFIEIMDCILKGSRYQTPLAQVITGAPKSPSSGGAKRKWTDSPVFFGEDNKAVDLPWQACAPTPQSE